MNTVSKIILSMHLCLLATAVDAVPPQPDLDDNGNASFVRQIVPKLLGRKPRGNEEVRVFRDIVSLHGREALVRALMAQPDFAIHWSRLTVDHLKIQRESGRAQSPQCFPEPEAVLEAGVDPELAEFVRDNPITSDYGEAFNMTELLLSSIAADNLFPAYRGNLYALAAKPPGSSMRTPEQVRAEVGKHFDDVYLNRDLDCIGCHRGTYSTTGIGDRTHPLYKTLELAIFDFTGQGEPDYVDNEPYQDYCASCHGEDGNGGNTDKGVKDLSADQITDVLLDPGPVMNSDAAKNIWSGILDQPNLEQTLQTMAEALGGPFGAVEGNETTLRHFASFRPDLFESTPNIDGIGYSASGWGPWDMDLDCAEIRGFPGDPAIPAYFAGFASDFGTVADIDAKITAGYYALPAALPGMAGNDASGTIAGEVAATYLLAASITEEVWATLMGEPLTLVNRFSRNADQKNLHQYLTEDIFIANDWSLRELIVEITRLTYFNRGAPASSMASGPYTIQPVYEPFTQTTTPCAADQTRHEDRDDDQRGGIVATNDYQTTSPPPNDHGFQGDWELAVRCPSNGQGDAIHRYAPTALFNSVGSALDWPAPKLFPDSEFPSNVLNKSIGQYVSDFDTGNKDVDFQGLLNWDSRIGICAKPDNVNGMDWIDRLHSAIDPFNADNPGAPLTLGELVLVIKDWLIQEPIFGGYVPSGAGTDWQADQLVFQGGYEAAVSEAQLVSDFFGGMSLDESVDADGVAESKLRELCGVYAKSPQFMLAGIIRNESFSSPRFRVCNDDNCTYQEMCQQVEVALEDLGYPLQCNSDSVSEPVSLGIRGNLKVVQDDESKDIGLLSKMINLYRSVD